MFTFRSIKILFITIFSLYSLSGCVSHKNLLNVQQKSNSDSLFTHFKSSYLVQVGDLLDIKVSSIDPQSMAIFNKQVGETANNQVNEASIYLSGYAVNDSGFITMPLIGQAKVKGKKISEIRALLEDSIKPYYKYASVDVKLMSFRITVLGEVNSQGTFNIYNEQTNLLQLIGMAGGITDLGNREKIRIIRKESNKSKLTYVDISKPDIIASEYFYMQPNDIIYVEPLKAKPFRVNSLAVQVGLSTLTFIIVMLNFIK